jgi:hypothetical protein
VLIVEVELLCGGRVSARVIAVVADESKYLWTDTAPAEGNWLAQKRNVYERDGDMVLA